ncbi:sulfite exporter TauE/SafE family protein [Geodermatophilus sp. SYSU D00697]
MSVAAVGLGLLIGVVLGALGGGGAVLTVPALVHVLGLDAQAATTASLFIVGTSAVVAALGHARSGRVRWGVGAGFGVAGIAAGFAGTALNQRVDPDVLLLAFSGVVLLAAAAMLAQTRSPDRRPVPVAGPAADAGAPAPPTGRSRVVAVVGVGLVVGFLTGFFGVGGGFVIVPALTLVLRLPMGHAVGTSLVVIAVNSGAALVARAGTAHFDWAVIAPFTLAAVAGSLVGKRVADRLDPSSLTRAFAVLLVVVALYTGGSALVGLLG